MRWHGLAVAVVAVVALVQIGGCGRAAPPAQPGSRAAAAPTALDPAAGEAAPAAEADPEALPEPNRPLTAGEQAMLRPIFRDGIDYTKVRVIDAAFPLQPRGTYMTPRGHIYAPGELFRDDFSLPQLSGVERAVFVHEMTHVWQYANGIDLVANAIREFTKYSGAYERAYPYRLEVGRDLAEYGMEQQASILEDYYLITVDKDRPYRMENRGLSARERDELYAVVLRRFLTDARYARGQAASELAEQHGMSSDREPPGPAACEEPEAEHRAAHLCGWRFQLPPAGGPQRSSGPKPPKR